MISKLDPHRVFLTGSGIIGEARQVLEERGCLVETGDKADEPSDLVAKLSAYRPHALIVRQGRISAAVQDAAPDLRVICKHGVGVDNIDIAAATQRGIPVLFTPAANFEAAAQHALASILALLRELSVQDRRIRRGVFDKRSFGGLELTGKTLGLIGFGRIARRLLELVLPMRPEVLIYHPSATSEPLPEGVRKVSSVDDIFRNADVISLHCPLNSETEGLIDREAFRSMKEGAVVVNTARGRIVDEDHLVEAIEGGRIAGAALDVFAEEPLPPTSPLLSVDSIILSPHVAGVSDRSFLNMGMDSVRQILTVLDGRPVERAVVLNPETLEPQALADD